MIRMCMYMECVLQVCSVDAVEHHGQRSCCCIASDIGSVRQVVHSQMLWMTYPAVPLLLKPVFNVYSSGCRKAECACCSPYNSMWCTTSCVDKGSTPIIFKPRGGRSTRKQTYWSCPLVLYAAGTIASTVMFCCPLTQVLSSTSTSTVQQVSFPVSFLCSAEAAADMR